MKKEAKKILVVDDEPGILSLLEQTIDDLGHDVTALDSPKKAIKAAGKTDFDIAFIDMKMPEMSGTELMKCLHDIRKETVVIIVTAYGSVESAVECMKSGAFDFITKPFQTDEIRIAIEKITERKKLIDENIKLKEKIKLISGDSRIIGKSKSITGVLDTAAKAAKSQFTIMITGESGSGKEMIAHYIHENSARASMPFIPVQCSNLPDNLFESELFGHRKGSFTGALEDKAGILEEADGGTVFLDEIGDIGLNIQGRLLRFLQEKEVRRVGDTKARILDVRLIAATNKNLEDMIKNKTFREDLFYRLNVMRIHTPPLRERKEDIPALVKHFIANIENSTGKKYNIENEVFERLMDSDWKGNVRELKNCIENASAICENRTIRVADLDPILNSDKLSGAIGYRDDLKYQDAKKRVLGEFDKKYLNALLSRNNGNLTKSAKTAGMDKKNFWSLLKKSGIKAKDYK